MLQSKKSKYLIIKMISGVEVFGEIIDEKPLTVKCPTILATAQDEKGNYVQHFAPYFPYTNDLTITLESGSYVATASMNKSVEENYKHFSEQYIAELKKANSEIILPDTKIIT